MERKSPFKFDLAGCPPQVVAKGGTIQEANQSRKAGSTTSRTSGTT
jgi:hypothetical protein